MVEESRMRDQVVSLLEGGHAHLPLEAAVADFPMDAINHRAPNVPYTPWALLEHIRLAQEDILDFIVNPNYQERAWPDDYWPARDYQATPQDWEATITGFRADLEQLLTMTRDPEVSMLEPFEHAPKYNLLRELLTVADHNAYHVGEFAILRQVMGTWGERQPG